jgi:putative transposase
VSYSAAIEWLKLMDETGSIAPGKVGGYKPKKRKSVFGLQSGRLV